MTEDTSNANPQPAEPDASATGASRPRKTAPDALVLRASPRRIVRLKRGVIVGAAAGGALIVAGAAWLALGPKTFHVVNANQDKAGTDHRILADGVAGLPNDYSQVTATTPVLGPPLPGDLGKPILDRQRQLASTASVSNLTGNASTSDADRQGQAAEAARERVAAQAAQAREAGVLVQSSTQAPVATTAAGAATGSTSAASASAPDTSRLALDPDHDQNDQQRKLDFIAQASSGGIYNPHTLQSPASPYEVMAGSVIAASLITGLNSDLPGQVIAQVTENVYDTVTGRYLLIPQGSRLIGTYDSVVAFGQRRALLVWQRIILPDGSSLEIDNLPATDAGGYAGLSDKVDFHTWQLLKGVGLSTLLGVGTQLSLSGDSDLIRAIRESTQQSAAQAGGQIAGKSLSIQPTITVRPGWPLRIVVHRDLVLRHWTGAR